MSNIQLKLKSAMAIGTLMLTCGAVVFAQTANKSRTLLPNQTHNREMTGAKSVLVTLWAVADDSTRDLMTGFYQKLEDNPEIGKAETLRQSQVALIQEKTNQTGKQSQRSNFAEKSARKNFCRTAVRLRRKETICTSVLLVAVCLNQKLTVTIKTGA